MSNVKKEWKPAKHRTTQELLDAEHCITVVEYIHMNEAFAGVIADCDKHIDHLGAVGEHAALRLFGDVLNTYRKFENSVTTAWSAARFVRYPDPIQVALVNWQLSTTHRSIQMLELLLRLERVQVGILMDYKELLDGRRRLHKSIEPLHAADCPCLSCKARTQGLDKTLADLPPQVQVGVTCKETRLKSVAALCEEFFDASREKPRIGELMAEILSTVAGLK